MFRFLESVLLAGVELVLGHPVRPQAPTHISNDLHLHVDATFIVEGLLDEDDIEEAGRHLVGHTEQMLQRYWEEQRRRQP